MEKRIQEVLKQLQLWGCAVEEARERMLKNDELYLEFLTQVAEEEEYKQLKELLAEQKYKAAFDVAHAQKGVVANLGLTPIYQKVCILVEKLRHEEYTDLLENYKDIAMEYRKLRTIMGMQTEDTE